MEKNTNVLSNERELATSDEITEIITSVPPWIIRIGILLSTVILIVFIVISDYIKYPEIIKVDIIIEKRLGEDAPYCYFGKIVFRQQEINKIKKGQKVIINLHKFPKQQYSIVIGYIAERPYKIRLDGNVENEVDIDFSSKYEGIAFEEKLIGEADVIVANNSLLDRIVLSKKKEYTN